MHGRGGRGGFTRATRTGAQELHACRRTRGSGGNGRNGTSALWPAHSAAARRRCGPCLGGPHRRTSRGGCARSCRAGARRPVAPMAQGRGSKQQVHAWLISPLSEVDAQSGDTQDLQITALDRNEQVAAAAPIVAEQSTAKPLRSSCAGHRDQRLFTPLLPEPTQPTGPLQPHRYQVWG